MTKVVDTDGHILEPSDLWEKNLEPEYRDRPIRIRMDGDGLEYLELAGKKSVCVSGGGFNSFGSLDADIKSLRETSEGAGGPTYEESIPEGARNFDVRLAWMDHHGIDLAIVYPSLLLGWQDEVEDAGLASAYCRVYNTWLTDLCRPYSERMVPIAHVALHNIEDAVIEVNRAAKLGARGVYLFATPVYDIPYGDRRYDPFWEACQDLNLPIGIHVSNTPKHAGRHLYQGGFHSNYWWFNVMYNQDCQMAFTSFFQGGVFERFPKLSVGVVETGCGWIAHWLELLDSKYKITGHPDMTMLPSEYFDRQGWITGEADEKTFPHMAQLVGAHKLMFGSDYPHEEGHEEPVSELKETINPLSQEDQDLILGGNALRIYNLQ